MQLGKLRKYSDYEKCRQYLLQAVEQYLHVKWPEMLMINAGQDSNVDVI
jgi:hypothetical protein